MKTYKVTVNNGTTYWYNEQGQLHREDGPAVENSNIYREWYINGKRHREDGPAVENSNGYKSWYINGIRLAQEEFNSRNKKEITISEIEKILGYSIRIVKG